MRKSGKTSEQRAVLWRRVMVASGTVCLLVGVWIAADEMGLDTSYIDLSFLGAFEVPVVSAIVFCVLLVPLLLFFAVLLFYRARGAQLIEMREAATDEAERLVLAKRHRALTRNVIFVVMGGMLLIIDGTIMIAFKEDAILGHPVEVYPWVFGVTNLAVAATVLLTWRGIGRAFYDPRDGSYPKGKVTQEVLWGALFDGGRARRRRVRTDGGVASVVLKVLGVLLAVIAAVYGVATLISGDGDTYRAVILLLVASVLMGSGRTLGAQRRTGAAKKRKARPQPRGDGGEKDPGAGPGTRR